jgi:hypothetical protein
VRALRRFFQQFGFQSVEAKNGASEFEENSTKFAKVVQTTEVSNNPSHLFVDDQGIADAQRARWAKFKKKKP